MEKNVLEGHVAKNLSIRKIVDLECVGYSTVRYWLKKHGLQTRPPSKHTRFQETATVFRNAVQNNISIAGGIRSLHRAKGRSSYKYVHRRVQELGIDTSHWKGRGHGTQKDPKTVPWSEVLVKNSPHVMTRRRVNRLLKEKLLQNKCDVCGMGPTWQNKPITLRLDHINGIRNDHRITNLRLVCPNCDSQLSTFCGRNKRNTKNLL